jgi:hypothetical protein
MRVQGKRLVGYQLVSSIKVEYRKLGLAHSIKL